MAAENCVRLLTGRDIRTSFNEAAAHGRGKRPRITALYPTARGFNEAAAHGRGKHWPPVRHPGVPVQASMRPRRMAAENADAPLHGLNGRGELQ